MKAIIDTLKGIGEAITSAIDFLFGLIEDIFYMVELLGQFIIDIPLYLSWLPAGIVSIFLTIFSIVVVYKIIGREG